MAGTVNPYADKERVAGEAPGPILALLPHSRYTVPDIPESTDPDYRTGFSPELRPSPDGTSLPDDIRIGLREPPVNDPNNHAYNRRRSADELNRVADETTVTGWNVQQRKVPAGQNPLWTQERMPIRPTADNSPLGYLHERPWHIPRNIAEAVGIDEVRHLSMADHRRTYSINTMAPRGKMGVNTFRLDPQPWDENLTVQVRNHPTPPEMSGSIGGNRPFRL